MTTRGRRHERSTSVRRRLRGDGRAHEVRVVRGCREKLMIENYRTGLIWNLRRRCPYLLAGLRRAGITGGWL
jgi:hypothetical protein